MHIKLLKSRNSEAIADYSGKKIRANNAAVIHKSDPQALRKIRQYENSPKHDVRARNLGLHFEISPADSEQGNEEQIIKLAKTFLQEMDLQDQPWILVRHSDIKRIHYHLISTRSTKGGQIKKADWLRRRAYVAAENSIRTMGFSFKGNRVFQNEKYNEFRKERGNVCNQIESVFYHVLDLPLRSREDFFSEMRKRNVEAWVSTRCKTPKLLFAGLSGDGKRAIAPIYRLDSNGTKLRMLDTVVSNTLNMSYKTTSETEDYELKSEGSRYDNEALLNDIDLDTSFMIKDSRILTKVVKDLLRKSVSQQDFEEKCSNMGIIITAQEDLVSGLQIEFSGFDGHERNDFGDLRKYFTSGELELIVHDNAWGRKQSLLESQDHKYGGRRREKK